MNPYLHKFDPDVTNAHYAEIVDAYHDTRPTRADVDDRPEPIGPKVTIEPCDTCSHLTCALQRALTRHSAEKENP